APPPPDPPTLTDEDEPPPQNLPTISIGNAQEVEDGLVMEFPVTLSEATAHTVTVDYATEEGTAHESVDYGGVWHSTLRIPPGAIRRTIYVVIVEDVRRERAEAFQVVLSNPTGATIAKGTATGTVIDND
ncbi:MAG: hypothetical protein OXG52_11100, partial [bacterium]|nr:hypothetical protein [bacterium]